MPEGASANGAPAAVTLASGPGSAAAANATAGSAATAAASAAKVTDAAAAQDGGSQDGGGGSGAASAAAALAQPETRGFLYKWTNYLKGYQKRWFVLANGLLHYYRNQGEMSRTCRGSISLHGAHIYTEDSCNFIVSNAGGTQTYHLRAASEVERQNWVTALELAKTRAIQRMSSDEEEIQSSAEAGGGGGGGGGADDMRMEVDKQELVNVVKFLSSKLEDMRTCHGLIEKNRHALQHSLTELETVQQPGASAAAGQGSPLPAAAAASAAAVAKELGTKMKMVNERATLLNITCNAMINASSEFLDHCQTHGKRWQKILESEREIRQQLEDMVQQLAKQQFQFESMVKQKYELQVHHDQEQLQQQQQRSASPAAAGSADGHRARSPRSESASHNVHVRQRSVCSAASGSDDEDLFEDATDELPVCFDVPLPPSHRRTSSELSGGGKSINSQLEDDGSASDDEVAAGGGVGLNSGRQIAVVQRKPHSLTHTEDETEPEHAAAVAAAAAAAAAPSNADAGKRPVRQRRTRIPDKPNISFSLWSIMKNCIGKDLSKIPVPVNFSEPLSMLQRLMEDFEYSEILDRAADCRDNCEQMAYVAAFTVSAYSTTAIRTGKPFNPLLGETYECDRSEDRRWRGVTEQVSHHPPMVAQYIESTDKTKGWKCWQEFTMRSRFKGKYLEVEPLGIAHLELPNGNHYTWRKVKTVVHNIVIGKLWIDQHGEMEIINHFTGDKCHMKFEPYSYFGGVAKKVTGTVINGRQNDRVEWVLNGTWDTKLEASRVIGEGKVKGKSSLEVDDAEVLWVAKPPYPESENFYNMSQFACELNEEEEGVAPTDCRLRPDQRLMEQGEWDQANTEKVRLEEKQRAKRREREKEEEVAAQEGRMVEPYQPVWFKRIKDEQNGEKLVHAYRGGYWERKEAQKWDICPDLF